MPFLSVAANDLFPFQFGDQRLLKTEICFGAVP